MAKAEVQYSAAVLRNKGVPIEVHALDDDGAVQTDGEGAAVTALRWVRFDFNAIADIEEEWDGTSKWEAALSGESESDEAGSGASASLVRAVRKTLSIVWNEDPREVGAVLITQNMMDYTVAIGVAWGLANGLDPTFAAERLTEATATIAAAKAKIGEVAEGNEPNTEPTGMDSPQGGSPLVDL